MNWKNAIEKSFTVKDKDLHGTTKALLEKFIRPDRGAGIEISAYTGYSDFSGNFREGTALFGNASLGPPPFSSIFQHKGPVFGKPLRWFSYDGFELASSGFSQAIFLSEGGGYGLVHRGVLPEGQVIAVKKHELSSFQGDVEFGYEVEVLCSGLKCWYAGWLMSTIDHWILIYIVISLDPNTKSSNICF
ncbi:unnamed protein product [Vicia faba]|uniref:non-specific serine/threonine protein kinase n=1 Tax=Vicia faba TaxID=3906 RepID=A0AAV0YY41_VICFA|nr:unnamed protein product [Vicia faba]